MVHLMNVYHERRFLPDFVGFVCSALVAALLLFGQGCAGHAASTEGARSALDEGRPQKAIELLNENLDVDNEEQRVEDIDGDNILYILDRATVLQEVNKYALSSRDLEIADKQIEVLDFSTSAIDDIGKYLFSDDVGHYKAPAYEKLMINTMNMINYLARGDLNGARVEARRFSIMQKFLAGHEDQGRSLSGPGSYLAGFIFEKSNKIDDALRYYDEALQCLPYRSLEEPIQRLSSRSAYRSPQINNIVGTTRPAVLGQPQDNAKDDRADVLVIINYGRVPAKIARRIPIGLALTLVSGIISPSDHAKAAYLAGQGLVTWVNYPELGRAKGTWAAPYVAIDGVAVGLDQAFAVDDAARKAWDAGKAALIISAITRMITRVAIGEGTRRAVGGIAGALLSLGSQAVLTATDTPDTRSWSTLPARIAVGRMRIAPGKHKIELSVQGSNKHQTVDIQPGGWAVVNLTVLR
jgi:uncharacterized protein